MNHFYDNFLTALQDRYPSKAELVAALVELLDLEKESVYRRLRKHVFFTADEVMRIAGAWSISLDNIVCINPDKTRSFNLKMIEFVDPAEKDYEILERHNRDLELVGADPKGLSVEIVNTLPRGLYARSEPLTRFFSMKWRHKFSPEKALNFSEIRIPDRMLELDRDYVRTLHGIREVHSIHDSRMIEHVVSEIIYYQSIGMLVRDETLLLRDELLALVNYIENVALTGHFPGSKNKLFFYLSHTWIETEYLLYKSRECNISFVKVLERNAIASLDRRVLDRFMKMALATKRMSVLMSESNALQQTEFFTRQREIIMTL